LTGKALTEARAEQAAAAAFQDASPRKENAFKVELGQKTLVRALMQLADMTP
jgi:xanthine dehydrogenase YagS FAD-binding subunit